MSKRRFSFKFTSLFLIGLVLFRAFPLKAQNTEIVLSDRALRNALIETCYGNRVLIDLNDPAKTEISLEEAGLKASTKASLIADAEKTDGSYEALSDLLISYCLGTDTVSSIKAAKGDRSVIETILVDKNIVIEEFYILVQEYTIFEESIYTYFESQSFTEEQYEAIFFSLEFSTSVEMTELLVSYGLEESFVEEFVEYSETTIDEIESESSVDEDEDGIFDIEDDDDDGDGVADEEDTDDDGDGVEDSEEDDDADNDGIDDEEDEDDDGDGVEDVEDEDDDGDGVDDDDADEDGIEDEEDTDDDGDGVEDEEDTDDDGDGEEDSDDGGIMDDEGGDEGGEE